MKNFVKVIEQGSTVCRIQATLTSNNEGGLFIKSKAKSESLAEGIDLAASGCSYLTLLEFAGFAEKIIGLPILDTLIEFRRKNNGGK